MNHSPAMDRSEIALLLAYCAAFDQRTIGEADVEAWHAALDCPWVPNLRREEAQESVVAHYRATGERIAPADIIKRVRDERAVRMARAIPAAEGVPPTSEYQKARAADPRLTVARTERDPVEAAQEQLARSRRDRHAELDEPRGAS